MGNGLLDLVDLKKTTGAADTASIEKVSKKDIAIIGLAAKLPMAGNLQSFWENIKNGFECVVEFPSTRRGDTDSYLKYIQGEKLGYLKAAYLDEIDKFDCRFFRISPREASFMDPNQRLFLETAWSAIEDAGYGGKKLIGSRTGVYVGYRNDEQFSYKRFIEGCDNIDGSVVTGNLASIIASRISYLLDLKGPSMYVDTACSSALVAIHLACQGIRNGDCEQAIVGTVRLNLFPVDYSFRIGIETSSGKTKTFDDSSDGTAWGEGTIALLLKPFNKALKDGDNIYAIIKGSAINQDGSSAGITAPNALAQEDVEVKAWKDAGIDPETISYIEAHGTGTNLGDPIEIEGIQRAFRRYTDKKQFCGIGSVKTNIGHLDGAAGLAGLVKVILALQHKEIPPSVNFERPNRQIDFVESPVYVVSNLQKWETGGAPARCGVSSFGMSGTNCHIVLEEAPPVKNAGKVTSTGLHILALSAKEKEPLQQMVEAYLSFLTTMKNLDPEDLCYTANTGRGHYNYRLALIFSDQADLVKKLSGFNRPDFDEVRMEGAFYDYHKVVATTKKKREANEITEDEIRDLAQNANGKINDVNYSRQESADVYAQKEILAEICGLYIKGAQIEWDDLYKKEERRRIKLPTYPFERKRCWIELTKNPTPKPGKRIGLPLLDQCLAESFEQEIYVTEFTQEKHWVIGEHKLQNQSLLVGTAFLEMAIEACRKHFPEKILEFRDIALLSPLLIQEGTPKEVQTIVKQGAGFFEFVIASQLTGDNAATAGQWVKHAQGKVFPLQENSLRTLALDTIKERCNLNHHTLDYGNVHPSIFSFGPRWRNIREIHVGDHEYLKYIELDQEFNRELDEYILHPALMDTAINSIEVHLNGLMINEAFGEGVYLPFSYQLLKVYQPLPAKFYSHIRQKNPDIINSEIVTFDISLINPSGEICVEIENYVVKKMREESVDNDTDIYCQVKWIPEELDGAKTDMPDGSILIFRDKSSGLTDLVAGGLKQNGGDIIEVTLGTDYHKVNDSLYVIDGNELGYLRLMDDIGPKRLSKVLHMFTVTQNKGGKHEENPARHEQKSLYSLFYLTKALAKKATEDIDLIIISSCAAQVTNDAHKINPLHMALFGLGRVVAQEYAKLKCRGIDIDEGTTAEILLNELAAELKAYHVAYREGKRYVEQYGEINIEKAPKKAMEIKDQGVYIITGGTGGIGLEIGKYFASKNKVNLALISRSQFPAPTLWTQILEQGENLKLCRQIEAIREIERTGARVAVYSADISDEAAIKDLVKQLRSRFGAINGIVHCAGVPGGGFMGEKSDAQFAEVLAPKIEGAWILDQATAEDHLDFLVMCSSVIAVYGQPGQGDYTAANAYLDSFASYRSSLGKRTVSINWTAWKETGMAADLGVNDFKGIFKPIDTALAVKAFDEVIHSDLTRVIIGNPDYDTIGYLKDRLYINLADDLRKKVEKRAMRFNTGRVATRQKAFAAVKLLGKPETEIDEIDLKLARIWGAVLGIEEFDVYDGFEDLGGDSVLGMGLAIEIDKEFPGVMGVADIFSFKIFYDMAEFLRAKLGYQKKNTANAVETNNLIQTGGSIMECLSTGMFQSNCYIFGNNGEGIIIDAGVESNEVIRAIEKTGLRIKGIVLTHGHVDHILFVEEVQEKTGAPIFIHEAEQELLTDGRRNGTLNTGKKLTFKNGVQLLKDHELLKVGGLELEIIHTPGHTLGSICIKVGDMIFTGDTLFQLGIGKPDATYGNTGQIRRSIIDRLMIFDDATVIWPGHGGSTSIGDERKKNPFQLYD